MMNGTTLTDLGWSATDKRTDPPERETDAHRPINDGYSGMLIREQGNGAAVMYMENPIDVIP